MFKLNLSLTLLLSVIPALGQSQCPDVNGVFDCWAQIKSQNDPDYDAQQANGAMTEIVLEKNSNNDYSIFENYYPFGQAQTFQLDNTRRVLSNKGLEYTANCEQNKIIIRQSALPNSSLAWKNKIMEYTRENKAVILRIFIDDNDRYYERVCDKEV